jgi:hypothetical protein
MMFASKSIGAHLLRGAVGFGLCAAAIALAETSAFALILFPLALVALRGCPMCWMVGLIETVSRRRARLVQNAVCPDGQCAPRGDTTQLS